MSETNSELASPEAEKNFNLGTAARTRPLSFEEIIERRKGKSEIVDSPKEPSISADFDEGSESEPPSRKEGWRLASMVVSCKAEEEFESKERDRDGGMVRESATDYGPTSKRDDMRKGDRYEELREKRRRSTSRERRERERERERENNFRERNKQDRPPERRVDRREPPPERRVNMRDLPPARYHERKADRRDQPRSPERKSDRMDRPRSRSRERIPDKRDRPHSRSPVRRPEKWERPRPRPHSRSPEKKSDRQDHPRPRSLERKSDKQDRIRPRSKERRSDRRDQPRLRSPERRPEKQDLPRSGSPGRKPERDQPRSGSLGRRSDKRVQPRSRSPERRPEKWDRPHSRSPQRRPEKRDRPRSRSPQRRPEKRNRPRSRSPGKRLEPDRARSRSAERRPNKQDRASSRSPERRSDNQEQPHSHSPERKSDKWDRSEKKPEKPLHHDKENIVDNSSGKQDKPATGVSSLEKKSDKWDKPPAGVSISDQPGFGSILGAFQTTIQNMLETSTKSIVVEPAQLTQATRPQRRLYVESVPESASEKTLIDGINAFFPETNPCLTCTINKEKQQAVVEFLTPEDATKALSFDGRWLLGTVLKIRRPKDYVEMPNVTPEKPVEEKVISDIVKDSPHKIFIAGINCQLLSSQELLEIVSVWGPLKAYRFMYSEELGEPCAFLEYEDHSVTLNACASLNGMRIGTRVITVVQALPDAPEEPLDDKSPSYDVPLHVKPLLVDATPILQLKNMYNRDIFLQMSKTEVEEDIEDIRLTCARFGTVKSVKIVPYIKSTVPEEPNGTIAKETGVSDTYRILEKGPDETENADCSPLVSSTGDGQINGVGKDPAAEEEYTGLEKSWISEIPTKQELDARCDASNGETAPNGDVPNRVGMEEGGDSEDLFSPGSVLVEFIRKEAACMAAHELHGELFGGQVIEAGYVPLELYLERFSE